MQSNLAATLNLDWVLDLILGVLAAECVVRERGDLLAGIDRLLESAPPGTLLFTPISEGGERGPFVDSAGAGRVPPAPPATAMPTSCGRCSRHRARRPRLLLRRDGTPAARGPRLGGGARSRVLRAMLAAALRAPVRTVARGGAAGTAMIAAVSLGLHADMQACADQWVGPHLSAASPPTQVWRTSTIACFRPISRPAPRYRRSGAARRRRGSGPDA
jgi:erythritol kinase